MRVHFTIIFIHLIVCSCIFVTKVNANLIKYENIAKSYVATSDRQAAISYVDAYLITSVIMLGMQIFLSVIGLPYAKSLISYRTLSIMQK
jgi:hypothetical protein